MPLEENSWQSMLNEMDNTFCPFCLAKCYNTQAAGAPIWQCPNNSIHGDEGQIWAWYHSDSIELGIIQINIRMGGEFYSQFCFNAKTSHLTLNDGKLININYLSLKTPKQDLISLHKALIIFG